MLAEDGTFQKPVISAGHGFWGLEVREEAGEAGGVGSPQGVKPATRGLTVQPSRAGSMLLICSGIRD